MRKLLIFIIDLYRKYISPIKGPKCRFYPSCSSYSKDAIIKYGTIKGVFLSFKRILKCHPFHPGGYDPLK